METQVMVDIETLGLDPGSVVLSIGATKWTRDEIIDIFYVNIDLESCTDHGLEIDPRTLSWWLEQDSEAQDCLTGGIPLEDALSQFDDFYDADYVWANSPAMDCSVLEAAYESVGRDEPWDYDEERDLRTLEHLCDNLEEAKNDEGVEHNARDDAVRQTRLAQKILRDLV